MKLLSRIIFFLPVFLIFNPAFAQDGQLSPEGKGVYQAAPPKVAHQNVDVVTPAQYKAMAQIAIRQRPANFDFTTFRSYYGLVDWYDPLGEQPREKLVALAYEIQNTTDADKRKKALKEYSLLMQLHLANYDVVSQAMILAKEDPTLGDPSFYEWMRRGLLLDVMNSGDGRNLMGAYDIMTLGEEMSLMNVLNVEIIETQTAEEGGVYYNMHKVNDPKFKSPYWIFTNVSAPMAFLAKGSSEKAADLDIQRQ